MTISQLRLGDLRQDRRIVDANGLPTPELLTLLNGNTRNLRNVLNALVDAVNLIQAAQAAADAANAAAAAAQTAADSANAVVEQIETGTLDLEAVTVGGQRFINNGGVLEVEP